MWMMGRQLSRRASIARPQSLWCMMLSWQSFSSSMAPVSGLNIALITGTTRKEGPPRPILGPRVAAFITSALEERGNTVQAIDPNEFDLLEKPHFCYSQSQVPPHLEAVHEILEAADAYVCITPEYNHAPSPALVNVLNHFGSSTFSFKPSAIVSYSAGQWGGTRAALGMRPILSELGCLPVSAMIHVPNGATAFPDESGVPAEDPERWKDYCDRCFSQLEWWGTAAKKHKETDDPFDSSPTFQKSPSERNAP